MSKSAHTLKHISIASPCTADWNAMLGNDAVRFCRHCQLHVHDLSLMTESEALRLVRNSNGRLCLRYIRRPDGIIQTAAPHQKLYLIKRRASRLAAGAFGATLSLCASVTAQTPSAANEPIASCEAPLRAKQPSASVEGGAAVLVGTVFDINQAVIPGAALTLTNESTGYQLNVTTNDEGQYRFQALTGGYYTLLVEAPGFVRHEIKELNVQQSSEQSLDVTLEAAAAMLSGVVVVASPSEPLIQAIFNDDLQGMKELLGAGTNVNAVDGNYDTTALAEAAAKGNQEMVQLLLRAGADVNLRSKRGRTAIMSLSDSSTAGVVQELVAAGARINEKDEEGNTPLLSAVVLNNSELVRALLNAGANVNEQNEAGQTALMLAAREGRIENAQALLDAGANINLEDDEGWTALKYAQVNSQPDVAELLKSYGAVN